MKGYAFLRFTEIVYMRLQLPLICINVFLHLKNK